MPSYNHTWFENPIRNALNGIFGFFRRVKPPMPEAWAEQFGEWQLYVIPDSLSKPGSAWYWRLTRGHGPDSPARNIKSFSTYKIDREAYYAARQYARDHNLPGWRD